ncbi:BAG family molecular chaperone regulator 3-like [Alnus glutinosa]|uniref:BAG family molecular chaperone regulator 3-like n=1 Tax=Alnus glutinosa TaxID=3517 RepID=UPI002D76894B|nr:BAG family molecular chaperone regulator 3-like [Alnus glutinosa]
MMKKRSNGYGKMSESSTTTTTTSSTSREEETEWEMRPGGMLVQKRSESKDIVSAPTIRLRVAYGALRHEISVNSQATFGEVKKLLTAETGLQPDEQRVIFRGKERENGEYLDMCGLKDRSKVILMQDPSSIERRVIQMRRNAKIQSAHRAISDVSMEVDKLAEQVSAIEKSITNGVKVPEVQITTLIEMLMRLAIKLDSISAEGDAHAQKNLQGKRVQKCVETLDVVKISNARVKPVIVTTKWETFDPPPTTPQWEFFD